MAFEIITYRDWKFEVDRELTRELYSEVLQSGAEECGCEDCKYFQSIKYDVFPQEIRDLFGLLGIDILKEAEVYTIGNHKIECIFNGWFLFVGRIIEGNDCHVPTSTNTWSIQLCTINHKFSIGFTHIISQSNLKINDSELVQVEFNIKYYLKPFWD